MNFRRFFASAIALAIAFSIECAVGQQSLRIVAFNFEDKPVNSAQDADLRAILGAIGNSVVLGTAQNVDILAFQEGPQSTGAYSFVEGDFETVFGGDYEVFFAASDSSGDRTGVVYNASRLTLLDSQSISNGYTHPTTLVTMRPIDGTVADEFTVISVHLKAGTTGSDAATRAAETAQLNTLVNTLPANSNFIIAGDFNMKGSDEAAWSGLMSAGALETINAPFGIRIAKWNDNLAFQPFHSQEVTGLFGGMDDRFDLQLVSAATMDDVAFEYVCGSLSVLGNNGTHVMNSGISSGSGAMGVQGNLLDFSDHLPVFADYQYGVSSDTSDSILNVLTTSNYTVRPDGPRTGTSGSDFLNIEGDGNSAFASFGVLDIDLSGVLATGVEAANTKDLGLELVQANAGFTRNGPYSIYIASAAASQVTIDSTIMYQTGNNGIDCAPSSLNTGATLIATFPGVHYTPSGSLLPDGTIDDVALYGSAFETALLDVLNTGGTLRLLLVPDQDETAATFAGATNASWAGPTLFGDYKTSVIGDPVVVFGESFDVTHGTLISGTIAELAESDNADLIITRSPADIQSRTEIVIKSTSPYENPSELEVKLEGSVFARLNVTQKLDLFDYTSGTWEEVDFRNATSFMDSIVTVMPPGNLSRFVETGTGCIEAKIIFNSENFRQQFSSNTDLFQWTITP